jgi:hypothetical protein
VRYALLAYAEPGSWEKLTDEERAAWEADDAAFDAELERRGCVVHGGGLADPLTATTVRVTGGEAVVTDGPVTATAEHLDAYVVVDVGDLDEALALAKRCPAARIGPLEVRPLGR